MIQDLKLVIDEHKYLLLCGFIGAVGGTLINERFSLIGSIIGIGVYLVFFYREDD